VREREGQFAEGRIEQQAIGLGDLLEQETFRIGILQAGRAEKGQISVYNYLENSQ
jgi:hypothetical protein